MPTDSHNSHQTSPTHQVRNSQPNLEHLIEQATFSLDPPPAAAAYSLLTSSTPINNSSYFFNSVPSTAHVLRPAFRRDSTVCHRHYVLHTMALQLEPERQLTLPRSPPGLYLASWKTPRAPPRVRGQRERAPPLPPPPPLPWREQSRTRRLRDPFAKRRRQRKDWPVRWSAHRIVVGKSRRSNNQRLRRWPTGANHS